MLKHNSLLRVLLYALAVFIILAVISAFAGRDNLFRFFLDPRIPFQTYQPPTAPDYSDTSSWVLPPVSDADPDDAHIFVVHPTTYWGGKDWNTDLDNEKSNDRLLRIAVPNWAGPFRTLGSVVVPKYRAASLYSFLTTRHDARAARALAYGDVLDAFDTFYASIEGDGPIVLVGVEQGGLHVLGLLQDRFINPHIRERLAVAYVIDFAVPLDLFQGVLRDISICQNPQSTQCIVTFNAFEPKEEKEIIRFRERSMVWDQKGRLHNTQGRALACVNPVLGSASLDYAPKRLHLGGANASGMDWGAEPAPLTAQTSAQCEEGVLWVDRPRSKSLRKKFSAGERFKPDPFNLFYADISKDAERRVQALRKKFETEGRLAPPFSGKIELHDSPINKTPDTE